MLTTIAVILFFLPFVIWAAYAFSHAPDGLDISDYWAEIFNTKPEPTLFKFHNDTRTWEPTTDQELYRELYAAPSENAPTEQTFYSGEGER